MFRVLLFVSIFFMSFNLKADLTGKILFCAEFNAIAWQNTFRKELRTNSEKEIQNAILERPYLGIVFDSDKSAVAHIIHEDEYRIRKLTYRESDFTISFTELGKQGENFKMPDLPFGHLDRQNLIFRGFYIVISGNCELLESEKILKEELDKLHLAIKEYFENLWKEKKKKNKI